MAEYRARFSSARASVAPARREVVEFARSWFTSPELDDIRFAAGEGIANAVEHGNRDDGHFEVYCRWDGSKLTIEILDDGPGFAGWYLHDASLPPPSAPRGYGTFIMHRLMDRVEYSNGGKLLRMVKKRRA